jgi:DNA-binding IclR family transcriptional regulator
VLGVGELASRTALPKGQISKILSTFRQHQILSQDPATRRYSVGSRAFALGSRFVNYHPLARDALVVMRQVVEQTGHSARLSVMDGDRVIYLLQSEGRLLADTGWRVGMFLPIHATTAGKVILAFLSRARVEQLLGDAVLVPFTPNTITDKAKLLRNLAEIRRVGYGISQGETTPGLGTIGVPIFGPDNQIKAVLGMVFPMHTVDWADAPSLAAMLHEHARGLSQSAGCPVYPFGGNPLAKPAALTRVARR